MPKVAVLCVALAAFFPLFEGQAIPFGIGGSGGVTIPIVQDDEGTGSTLTVRAIVRGLSMGALEAHLTVGKYGDPEIDLSGVTNDLEGSTLTSYGIDAILGGRPGRPVSPFLLLGVGFFRVSREQSEAWDGPDTDFGYSAGFGLAIGVSSSVGLDFRAKLNIVPADSGGSRKSAVVLGGLNYYFGM